MGLKQTLSGSEQDALETIFELSGDYYVTEERILDAGVSEDDFEALLDEGYVVGTNLGGADTYYVGNEGRAYLMLMYDDVPDALAEEFSDYMGITDVFAEAAWRDGTPVIRVEFGEGALEEYGITPIQIEVQKMYPFFFNAKGRSDYDPMLHHVEIDGNQFYLYFDGEKR